MKAVNLIPLDARRGAGAPSRSGGAVYSVLAVLGVLALIAVLYGLSSRTLNGKDQELAQLTADSAGGAAAAAALEPYVRFGQIADEREQTVETIADQRFDWGLAMRELARVLPAEVDLVTIDGSRQSTATEAAGATAGAPQVTLTGCASSQGAVALLLARLRAMRGVERVTLQSSSKGSADGGGTPGGDCRGEDADTPQFTLVVTYRADDDQVAGAAGATPAADGGQAAAGEGSS